MYAHQVIDDLDYYINKTEELPLEYRKRASIIKNVIKQSVKFSINNICELEKICGSRREMLFNSKYSRKFPYKKIWIDYSVPIVGHEGKLMKCGALIVEINSDDESDAKYHIYTFYRVDRRGIIPRDFPRKSAWVMHEWFYILVKKEEEGLIACNMFEKQTQNTKYYFKNTYIRATLTIIHYFALLLNCKNITTENNKPSDALNKARRKKGKQELFTYKTLKLLLPGKKEKHVLTNEPTGEHNRIHLCRGHFKEYTKEAPLFGRIAGLWWWQPTVRGKNKDGIVVKDYVCEVDTNKSIQYPT